MQKECECIPKTLSETCEDLYKMCVIISEKIEAQAYNIASFHLGQVSVRLLCIKHQLDMDEKN